ncbi:hypothetical protein GCM10010168_40360 [Actinoplanes ianthinogenes]|uniref:Chaplin domain-containing protein n=1 Tax=Actinoplanes ianthinogenes TaxID=122358 RepID=A0ABN6CDF2_9ACTN|nr:chaplin family protein [Actinoplanes ianthinogenes]BCJ43655.1 hypothetical protein Aiant_43120 [Actinoplanes ianthinogenes]GGR18566.1 hypothetical protein GCM10010168_40360 [Actinoplanes ianthinogenes]
MKKTWVRKTLSVGIMAAGALLMAPVAAQAGQAGFAPSAGQDGVTQVSYTNLGALNGTQFAAPVTAPINMNGNAIALGGISRATGAGVNRVEGGHRSRGGNDITQRSAGNVGFLNGTQIAVPITMPINQNGNADSLFGISDARGTGVNHVQEHSRVSGGGWNDGINQATGGNVGFLNGTQIAVPITIPINQCGNADSVFGVSQARATCANFVGGSGRGFQVEGQRRIVRGDGGWDNGVNQSSFGNIGFLNGSQFAAPVIAPINACGNSLGGLLGASSAQAFCVNRIGGGDDRIWVKKPHHHKGDQGGDVQGDNGYDGDDCTKKCDDDNTGDVRGDHGYNGEAPAVNDDKGYGDVKGDDNGYGDEAPAVNDDKGYGDVSPDKYGDKTGGRKSTESTAVGSLTGSLGGLDLLDSLS